MHAASVSETYTHHAISLRLSIEPVHFFVSFGFGTLSWENAIVNAWLKGGRKQMEWERDTKRKSLK